MINDAIRDLRGNVVELIAPNGASTFTLYDGLDRAVSQTQGYGTSLALTNSTEYDVWGKCYQDDTHPRALKQPGLLIRQAVIKPIRRSQPTIHLSLQRTDITYDSSGRRKTVVAPGTNGLPDSNRTAEIFYSMCCGQTVGAKNAMGHGQIQSSNAKRSIGA